MPTRRLALTLALVFLAAGAASAAEDDHGFPLSSSRLTLGKSARPDRRHIQFQARWRAAANQVMPNPIFAAASLRVAGSGAGDGDSGVISLPGSHWFKVGRRGYRYRDPAGTQSGIRTILLKGTPPSP